jgi:acetylglutamate kinase
MSSGPLIIKIGGAGVDDPFAAFSLALWQALKQAHQILKGQLVLIHGGGRAVDQHLDKLGIKTDRREGIRITPPDIMPEITAVLAGRVNKALIGAIQTTGLPAVGLSLGDGLGSITSARSTDYKFDPGQVGKITGGDGRILSTLMAAGYLPVLCSIGLDAKGQTVNINADDAAAGIARITRARNVVLLTDVPGILDKAKKPIPRIDSQGVASLIADGTISGGMIPKAKAALAAANVAGTPATIASWNNPHDLVRLAQGELIGTQVVPSAPLFSGSTTSPTTRTPPDAIVGAARRQP